MAFQAIFLCASALLVQSISGQCVQRISSPSCGYSSGGLYSGLGGSGVVSNNGGSFVVTSVGPIAPSGIAVTSDLALCGDLGISGTLPFLSAVAFDGTYPTSGAGSVSYGCGDGNIAINTVVGGSSGSYGTNLISGNSAKLGCGCY